MMQSTNAVVLMMLNELGMKVVWKMASKSSCQKPPQKEGDTKLKAKCQRERSR